MAAPWSGNSRRATLDPFNLDAWDPVDLAGYLWDPHSPGGGPRHAGDDVAAVVHTLVDWRETDDAHIFKVDLPGLRKDDVKVHVEESRVLNISGELKRDDVERNDKWHRVERQHGTFVRRFRLPENAMVDDVKASMENGVLTVTVPKRAEAKPKIKTIDVSGN